MSFHTPLIFWSLTGKHNLYVQCNFPDDFSNTEKQITNITTNFTEHFEQDKIIVQLLPKTTTAVFNRKRHFIYLIFKKHGIPQICYHRVP